VFLNLAANAEKQKAEKQKIPQRVAGYKSTSSIPGKFRNSDSVFE
jgi:hypothetical protein